MLGPPRFRQLGLALAALALAGCSSDERLGAGGSQRLPDDGPVAGPSLPADAETATIERVIDGDTVRFVGGEKVRLIGIDTPEVGAGARAGEECFGREATGFARDLMPARSRVRYTRDRDDRDRYGRLLAYLWLDDGRSVNALMLERGFAEPLTVAPNDRYAAAFARLADAARKRGVGVWACR